MPDISFYTIKVRKDEIKRDPKGLIQTTKVFIARTASCAHVVVPTTTIVLSKQFISIVILIKFVRCGLS